jgi:hypothetical protein
MAPSFIGLIAACTAWAVAADRPNIVFLIDESTDGRTYRPDFPVSACEMWMDESVVLIVGPA